MAAFSFTRRVRAAPPPRGGAAALPCGAARSTASSRQPAIDPRKAVGSPAASSSRSCRGPRARRSADERVERRRELINTYVRVRAGARLLGHAGRHLARRLPHRAARLQLGGRGYADVYRLSGALPPLRSALEQLDPAWGNAAIALLAVELSAPLLIAATLAATPAATANLQAQLTEWNLDAEGLNARIEEVLEKTTD